MTVTIAMAGKGGTGKTSIAGLIIRYLVKHGGAPVLAVDADPAANLGLGLGLDIERTIGSVLAGFNENKITIPSGMSKDAYLNIKFSEAIVESRGVDLITMGRGEGAGCYCFPNNVLKDFIDKLTPNYQYMVMDNEAGLEHLSRGTTGNVDELIIVSNHSIKGVRTIATVMQLVQELDLNIKRKWVVINQAPAEIDPLVEAEMDRLGISPTVVVPTDELIMEYDLHQHSLLEMPDDSAAVRAIDRLMQNLRLHKLNEVKT
ncbi:AAA family ATPase [Dehalogenimonas sp. THU2]|uniref:ATP-binding protein n=1 Tax=Dehalogenimonas sp. THU2 TaxID=3151121 RepID=UPI0032186F61